MTQANYIRVLCTYIQNELRNRYIYMYMYCIERSVNIIITRITRVNKICFSHVAISDDISTHANFQVDSYHGC